MASIEIQAVAVAIEALTRAGRWSLATDLLDAIGPADASEAEVLAVARAENEVEHAFWTGRAADPDVGLSIRVVRQYTINNDAIPTRLDVLYGWAPLYPELACRVAA